MADVTFNVYIDWDNDGTVASGAFEANETVTANVLGIRTPLAWSFGRDTARSIATIKPGTVTIELNNNSKLYSPDYAAGALFGNLGPGKPVRIRATHNAINYDIFWGYIDSYELNPHQETRSVRLTCQDALGRFGEQIITTPLFESIQTGEAIEEILDAAGWSASKRSIDAGATTCRWWWADEENALTAITDLVKSEGPNAFAYIDSSGNFVFRDRHHRVMDTPSKTSQATFRDVGAESASDVNFAQPAVYDVGFRDLCNDVKFSVDERGPVLLGSVWEHGETFRIPASSTVTVNVKTSDPFFEAVTPVSATDYRVLSGSVSSVTLSRTSGASAVISITAGGSTTVVAGLRLRALSVPVQRKIAVTASDSASQSEYGLKSWTEQVPKWVGKNDAQAIADYIVAKYKDRQPVFEVTINSGSDNRKVQALTRDLSDRVTIIEDNSQSNNAYYVEKISHSVKEVGKAYSASFGCERVYEKDPQGTIFILDDATLNHRLDSGLLAT